MAVRVKQISGSFIRMMPQTESLKAGIVGYVHVPLMGFCSNQLEIWICITSFRTL